MGCSKNCNGCSGCGPMELTELEIRLLALLGQVAFLPVARKPAEEYPVCMELPEYAPENTGLALACLEKRGLVDLSYDAPLKGADMSAYAGYTVHGSAALTERGQQAADLAENLLKEGTESC